MTPAAIHVNNRDDKIYKYYHDDTAGCRQVDTINAQMLDTIDDDPKLCRFICVSDMDSRHLLHNRNKLYLVEGDNTSEIHIKGATDIIDIVFEDHHTFWILRPVNDSNSREKDGGGEGQLGNGNDNDNNGMKVKDIDGDTSASKNEDVTKDATDEFPTCFQLQKYNFTV